MSTTDPPPWAVSGPGGTGAPTPPVPGATPGPDQPANPTSAPASRAVARGGAINLIGAAVYGVANFVLLFVLNRTLGVADAAPVLVAIAIFSISSKFAELGCATGFIRWISHHRAVDRHDLLRATVLVGLVPVAVVGSLIAVALWFLSPAMASIFSQGQSTDSVATVLRAMLPFLPFSALESVAVQGTRGFDTMVPQTVIEKVGRAVALPMVVLLGFVLGFGPVGVGMLWAATNLVALVPALIVFFGLIRRAVTAAGGGHGPVDAQLIRRFWSYTGPRAVGQTSEITVQWADTIIVGALVSTSAAGIYASGTRYLLPGQYAADALMQVTGPRVSGLVAGGRAEEASGLVRTVTAWQTMLIWPLYLLVAGFAPVLLAVFGEEVTDATGALVALSGGLMIASLFGPAASVILMSGRSRQAMANTLALVVVNLGGNFLLVPRYGLTAAGLVWAATLVVSTALPAWQARRTLAISTTDRRALTVAGLAVLTIGPAIVVGWLLLGMTFPGLAAATVLGGAGYLGLIWPRRHRLGVMELLAGFRRTARPAPPVAPQHVRRGA